MRIESCLQLLLAVLAVSTCTQAADPIEIGSRRELLIDNALTERMSGEATLQLQHPVLREVAILHDDPWEGSGCGYHTVFRDGDVVRMYYIAAQLTNEDGTKFAGRPVFACYAESRDGKSWVKPHLGLFEFQGSKQNNIVWAATILDNFSPFKDANPNCRPGEEYKAVSSGAGGLFALKSSDGIHWSRLGDRPIISKGAFDSQNTAFWDPLRKQYWAYIRDFHQGVRDIRVSTSPDFVTWTEPQLLEYGDVPEQPLYTNAILPYPRAPHIFVGFPTRYTEREATPVLQSLPDWPHRQARMKLHPRYGTAITDGLFMSSRDGRTFHRWGEAFIRPGIERKHNWLYGDGYQNWGLLQTASDDSDAPEELSVYGVEDNWKRATRLRRYTLRIDGFVSLHAPLAQGELVTRPLRFTGKQLSLNFSTSGAGSIWVELQDEAGMPLPGFSHADCYEQFGDSLDRRVLWKSGNDVSSLSGKPVRLRFVLKDAELFSWKFEE
jgi:hypothetical protein